jgi:hypothetical protein
MIALRVVLWVASAALVGIVWGVMQWPVWLMFVGAAVGCAAEIAWAVWRLREAVRR